MNSTKFYLYMWQKALRIEINHLKKYGSSKYSLHNGQVITDDEMTTYYFETSSFIRIPIGAKIMIEPLSIAGKILSSEGKSVIFSVEATLGTMRDLYLVYDPWELLDQLHERLDEIKDNKRKRTRIKRLMNPSLEAKHPIKTVTSNVHELVLRSKYNPVTFVWGPPGTGKTYTLARVAANKYFKGKKVLILAQSNQAVDVLIEEVSRFITKKGKTREGDVLRYGTNSETLSYSSITIDGLLAKHYPSLAANRQKLVEERKKLKLDLTSSYSRRDSEKLLELESKLTNVLEKIKQKEIEYVKESEIIGTTLSKAATDPVIYEKNYDIVIVDEASMAYVPQIGFAATLASRIIICGDFKQLPPIAAARHKLVDEWLKEDIFHKANVVDWLTNSSTSEIHPQLFLLKEQRRMHPNISSFTNRYIYQSLVGDHESVKTSRNAIVNQFPFKGFSSVLVNTSGMGNYCLREKTTNSRFNLWQLILSFQAIHESYLSGAKSIGYITPYRAQAMMMDLLLSDLYQNERLESDIISATVHRFQGSERDVMIFDSVDSFPQERPGMLIVGKDSERLINVAITRTRGKFIHVCDKQFIQSNVYRSKTIRKLVEHQIEHNQEIKSQQIGGWIKNQHAQLLWLHAKKLERIQDDINKAKQSIIIGLPVGNILTKEWKDMLIKRQASVKLTNVHANIDVTQSLQFPFIIIDHKYLWLGMPSEAALNVSPPFVAARLHSELVIKQFLSELK